MDGMIYVGSSSGANIMYAQAMNANNLANANTPGFKADHPQFVSVLEDQLDTLPSRIYSTIDGSVTDFSPGGLMPTGNVMDVSINGEGWLTVAAKDGSESYLRTSSLQVTNEGLLVTASNIPVLGASGPITLPAGQKIEIGTDGTITATSHDGKNSKTIVIDRLKLVKPKNEDLVKMSDGLFRTKSNTPSEPDASVQLVSGYLETSNVNVVESMMNMITLSRQFEIQLKLLSIAKENAQSSDRTIALS
ncbi:MAG: flagellar basal body rod protein FlgF [Candidatus Berkiella sp.]